MSSGASLARRLLSVAGLFIAAALVVATVLIGYVLHRFVQGQIDQRLDTQIAFLASTLQQRPDGRLFLSGNADGPPFDRPHAGWYWQITGTRSTLKSASLEDDDLDDAAIAERIRERPAPPPKDKGKDSNREKADRKRFEPADGAGPDGMKLHYRVLTHRLGDQTVTIVASAPRDAVLRPLGEALTTLAVSLAILGIALFLAMLLQVRLGLRPLSNLRAAVADVREGRATQVPADQPREVAPLVDEINALLAENAANLERARKHVGNLAHGLKTPLATLTLALSQPGRDTRSLVPLVETMDRRVRHHLGRARAAALQGPARQRTPIVARLRDLSDAMTKIHGQRKLSSSLVAPPELAAACELQDFDEMAGNIIENAFKWARTQVQVQASQEHGRIAISVDDDGPGLEADDIARVLQRGHRLDEATPGHGLGLSIALELAELYGGSLHLERSTLGGLRAVLKLPAARHTV
jgi:signal transduction histidine kinase